MSQETETKKEIDPKVDNMLKALGYLDDINEQAKLPGDRDDDDDDKPKVEVVEEAAKTDEAKPDEAAAVEEKPDDKPADAYAKVDEVKPEAKEEAKKEDKKPDAAAEERARKVAPSKKQQQVTLDDIVGAVRDAVADTKKEPKAEVDTKPKDEEFKKNLHPAELKRLEMAEAAQRILGEKYKDAAQKEKDWIIRHREKVNEVIKAEGRFDPNNEEYIQFVRANRPDIPQHDREEIFLMQAEDRATKRVKKEMREEIASRDRAIAEIKFTPVIDRVGEAVKNDVLSIAGDGFSKAFNETPDKIVDDFPLEAPIVSAGVAEAVILSREYMSLVKGLKPVDESNKVHKDIISFITTQGKAIDSQSYTRDGKRLVSREKYYSSLDAGKDVSQMTTFDDADVVKMMSFAIKQRVQTQIASEKKRMEAINKKSSAPSVEKKEVKVEEKKEVVKSPPKGGSSPSNGAKPAGSASRSVPATLKALGYEALA